MEEHSTDQARRLGSVRRNRIGTTLIEDDLVAVWGIDPGTRTVGVAVIQRSESFTATIHSQHPKRSWWMRSQHLALDVGVFICLYTDPGQNVFGIEMPGVFGIQGNTAVKLGDVRGMIGAELLNMVQMIGYYGHYAMFPDVHPGTIRYSLAGSKSATNAEMISAAKQNYWLDFQGTKHEAMEEASALGIALATLKRWRGLDKPIASQFPART